MNTNTHIATRKIQLLIDSDDAATIKQCKETLYRWEQICFRSANYIITQQYIQQQVKELHYIKEDVRIRLTDAAKDPDGILTTSRMNTTYQWLSKKFKGEIPMSIISHLNQRLVSHFNREKTEYWKGTKTLFHQKRNCPMPFAPIDIRRLQTTPNGYNFSFTLFHIPFRTYLGSDRTDKKQLLQRLLNNELHLCTSHLQLEKGRVFLLAAFELPNEQKPLDINTIAEATLSLEHPIVVRIGRQRFTIGNKEEFLYRRLAMQASMQRVQQNATYTRSGKGRKRKLSCLASFHDKEKHYINYKLHLYSRRLIDLCLQYKAGTLVLKGKQETEAEQSSFLLRNWNYAGLKRKIEYKAMKTGIAVLEE